MNNPSPLMIPQSINEPKSVDWVAEVIGWTVAVLALTGACWCLAYRLGFF